MQSNSPLDTAGEKPSQHRKQKCAPPVGDCRHIGTIQEVMAYYATIEMFPREMGQFCKHHQCGEVKAQSRKLLFAHIVPLSLLSQVANASRHAGLTNNYTEQETYKTLFGTIISPPFYLCSQLGFLQVRTKDVLYRPLEATLSSYLICAIICANSSKSCRKSAASVLDGVPF